MSASPNEKSSPWRATTRTSVGEGARTLAVFLVLLWTLGVTSSVYMGGLVHVLLAAALAIGTFQLARSCRTL